jgi:hypothetical protein
MKNLNVLIGFLDEVSENLCTTGEEGCLIPKILDFSRADLLERWEAILLDLEFPNRKNQSRAIQYLIKKHDEGELILREK